MTLGFKKGGRCMPGLDDLKIAELSSEDLETIKALERKLGNNIRLVAVENKDVIYTLEAKLAPNHWHRVDRIYPEIKGFKAIYSDQVSAKEAKTYLKNFLITNKGKNGIKKRPIRIRQIVNTERAPSK